MRSPYAAPDTPIASAKRPRPNVSATKLDYGDAGSGEAEKENEVVMSPVGRPLKPADSAASSPGDQEEGTGKWRGHLGALFSPVLRIFGNEDSASAADIEQDRLAALEEQRRLEEERLRAEQQRMEEEESTYEEDEEEFNPYIFIKQLPPYHEAVRGHTHNAPRLPPRRQTRSSPVTLVLDLDETLVHCSVEATPSADLVFPVHFNGVEYQVHVQKRPHLEHFLREVSQRFEVVVFTASQQVYADKLLDLIDPKREMIKHRLFRDSCLLVEGNYLKDLNVLGRDLAKTVLVDNSPHAFGYQVDNGIPIESWFDDPSDRELLKLLQFLDQLDGAKDVRPIVREHYRTHQLISEAR